jgi:hypothetical protein
MSTGGRTQDDIDNVAQNPMSLRGKVLGIRADHTWISFTRFAQRAEALARRRLDVRDVVFFDPGIRIGTTEEERRKVAGFVRDVDAAIVGLGT